MSDEHQHYQGPKVISTDPARPTKLGGKDFEPRYKTKVQRPRRISRNPQWQETLGLYGDLLTHIRRNPPALSIASPNSAEPLLMGYPVELVENCEPWYVDAEMLELVEHAAASLDEHEWDEDDLVSRTGFAVFETPVWFDHEEFGEVPVRAISWKRWSGRIQNWNDDGHQFYVQAWFDLEHPDFQRDKVDLGYHGRLWPGVYTTFWPSERVDSPKLFTNASDEMKRHLLDLRRFTMAFWLLSAQRVAVISGQKPARGFRRQAERLQLPSTIVVVRLRRAESVRYEGEGSPREWSHRWIVSGHWKRLVDKKTGRVRKVWWNAHIRGPADKPLIVKDRFYRFER